MEEDEEGRIATGGDSRGSTALAKKFQRDAKGSGAMAGAAEEVSLYRKELAVIHYNSRTRPCTTGVRGMEVCIPNTFSSSEGGDGAEAKQAQSQAHSQQPIFNIAKPFDKIRAAGKQNEMFHKSCFVLHERNSRSE